MPETRDLTGDDAWSTLRRIGRGRLARETFLRLRVADDFSPAPSLSFRILLVSVEGLISVMGRARILHKGGVTIAIEVTRR